MNKYLSQEQISFLQNPKSVELYAHKTDGTFVKAPLNNDSSEKVKKNLTEKIHETLKRAEENEEYPLYPYSSPNDHAQNAIIYWDNKDFPPEIKRLEDLFSFTKTQEMLTSVVKSMSELKGFVFVLNDGEKQAALYKKLYPVNKIKGMRVSFSQSMKIVEDEEARIPFSFDFIFTGPELYIFNFVAFEDQFQVFKQIKDKALNTVKEIQGMDIVDNIEFLQEAAESKIKVARALSKIENLSILQKLRDKSLSFEIFKKSVEEDSVYSGFIKFNGDRIQLTKASDVSNLLKVLNDDILYSKLTGDSFNSVVKRKI